MPQIDLVNLSKSYGATLVCRDINLTIHDREFVTLLGSSGCGKTTILNMVGGLDEVTSGDIIMAGRRVNDLEAIERDVAMVFQNYALYPHMTVAQNIGFSLKLRKIPGHEIEKRVKAVAANIDLDHLLDRFPSQLSGGQQQRVAIGRAIVREPKIFLFDEPFSNLDAKLRHRMRGEVRELHDRLGVTTIFVTHDQEEALSISDRIAILHNGVIEQFGTPEEIYSQPETTYVAQFVGNPQVELLAAEIREFGGTVTANVGKASIPLSAAQAGALVKHDGGVAISIRPEFVAVAPDGIKAIVQEVQPIGPSTIVRLTWPGGAVMARLNGIERLRIGSAVHVALDLNHLLFFDADSGRRIPVPDY